MGIIALMFRKTKSHSHCPLKEFPFHESFLVYAPINVKPKGGGGGGGGGGATRGKLTERAFPWV